MSIINSTFEFTWIDEDAFSHIFTATVTYDGPFYAKTGLTFLRKVPHFPYIVILVVGQLSNHGGSYHIKIRPY